MIEDRPSIEPVLKKWKGTEERRERTSIEEYLIKVRKSSKKWIW